MVCHLCGVELPQRERGRPRRFCSDKCRKRASRLNGHETCSGRVSPTRTQKWGESTPQVIDFIKSEKGKNQELTPSLPSADLRFDVVGSHDKKKGEKPNTYKLTDGRQINTGSGRAARALGYVMEIYPRRWVARVRDCRSEPTTLKQAKQAALDLYSLGNTGQPQHWIFDNNLLVAREIDRVMVFQSINANGTYDLELSCGDCSERIEGCVDPECDAAIVLKRWGCKGTISIRHANTKAAFTFIDVGQRAALAEPKPPPAESEGIILQGDDYQVASYDEGYPRLPSCLRRIR